MQPFYIKPQDNSKTDTQELMQLFYDNLNMGYQGHKNRIYGVSRNGHPFSLLIDDSEFSKNMQYYLGENFSSYMVSAKKASEILRSIEDYYTGYYVTLDGSPNTKPIVDQFNLKYQKNCLNQDGDSLIIRKDGTVTNYPTVVLKTSETLIKLYKEISLSEFAEKLGFSLSHSSSSTMSSTLEKKANEMYFDKLNVTSTLKDIEAAKKISKTLYTAENNIQSTRQKLAELIERLDQAYANKDRELYKQFKSDLNKLIDYITANNPYKEFIELGKSLKENEKQFDPKEYLAS